MLKGNQLLTHPSRTDSHWQNKAAGYVFTIDIVCFEELIMLLISFKKG